MKNLHLYAKNTHETLERLDNIPKIFLAFLVIIVFSLGVMTLFPDTSHKPFNKHLLPHHTVTARNDYIISQDIPTHFPCDKNSKVEN